MNRVWLLIGVILIATGAFFFHDRPMNCVKTEPDTISSKVSSIFDYEDTVYAPYGYNPIRRDSFLYRLGESDLPVVYSKRGEDWYNPWVVAAVIIRNLVEYDRDGRIDAEKLNQCASIMESIKASFEREGKFSRPAYKKFREGWVSSMDAPSVMVASRMLYEITGDEKWHDFVKMLSRYVIIDVSEGGFNFHLDKNSIWPLEYAQKNISFDEAEFVLNGSLVGYLGIYMVAEVEQDSILQSYLQCVEKAYEKKFSEFPYHNYTWTKYMLHPPDDCQPHYVFFERALFASLSKLTGNSLFVREFAYRVDCLKSVLKPQFRDNGKKREFIIRRACSPHPYYIDVYPSKIVFYDANNQEIDVYEEGRNGHRDSMINFKEGEFLFGEVPKEAIRYVYFRGDTGEEIFSGNIEEWDFVTEADAYSICNYTLRGGNDALLVDNSDIEIANALSEKEEGTMIFDLHAAEPLDAKCYYGVEIENLTNNELSCGLIIRDEKEGVGRTYTPLAIGKNLILFNILGFKNIDAGKIEHIRRIDVRLYTNDKEVDGTCRAGKIIRFKDLFDLREYRMLSEYEIQPQ